MASMNAEERKALARDIAQEIQAQNANTCPLGMTAEVTATLKEIADTWRKSKSAFITSMVGLLVIVVGGLLMAGVIAKVHDWLK